MNKQTQEALKMAIDVMEGRCAWGKAKSEVIEICKEALEAEKPFMEGFRILVEYRNGEKWLRNQKRFTVYEPLVISDFSTIAGNTCTYMTDEIMKANNNDR
jgi:hypothetical protein